MEEAGLPGAVFDLVPGPDEDIRAHCVYLDRTGRPHGGRLVRKLRQVPQGFGDARLADVVDDDPVLREATLELARHMGLRGVVVAEFKRDSRDGTFRFVEVNGRSVVYNALLRRAGLDLAGTAWDEHTGGYFARRLRPDWRGVWIHLHPDALHAAGEVRRGRLALGEFLAPYRRNKIEAVWSSRDPMPFFAQWSRTLGAGVSAVTLRDRGREQRGTFPPRDARPHRDG
jgi:predicted ATP-grasp superfamily ATP-dependent carboligase